jgi:LysR family transcriptional regulator, glycine cleavage system transcriptional activator
MPDHRPLPSSAPRLPPLNALRAFDAVARLGSVKDAARELFVTPAAVSQQLKALESALGVRLLKRAVREVSLTDDGHVYHQATTKHLRAIAQATARMRPGKQVVNVTTVPSFATLWLVPRMQRFTQTYPMVEVRVEASPAVSRLQQEGFDLAVREGGGDYPGLHSRRLFEAHAIPVATPALAKPLRAKEAALRDAAWAAVRLIHESFYGELWGEWLAARGIEGVDATRGLHFSHTMLALAAAKQGQGVALAPPFLVDDELRAGNLVVVDSLQARTPYGYYAVWPDENTTPLPDAARLFLDWMVEEAAAHSQAGH